jgi:hypothetical protein
LEEESPGLMHDQEEKVLKVSRFFPSPVEQEWLDRAHVVSQVEPHQQQQHRPGDHDAPVIDLRLTGIKANSISSENFKLNLSVKAKGGDNTSAAQVLAHQKREHPTSARDSGPDSKRKQPQPAVPHYQKGLQCKTKTLLELKQRTNADDPNEPPTNDSKSQRAAYKQRMTLSIHNIAEFGA